MAIEIDIVKKVLTEIEFKENEGSSIALGICNKILSKPDIEITDEILIALISVAEQCKDDQISISKITELCMWLLQNNVIESKSENISVPVLSQFMSVCFCVIKQESCEEIILKLTDTFKLYKNDYEGKPLNTSFISILEVLFKTKYCSFIAENLTKIWIDNGSLLKNNIFLHLNSLLKICFQNTNSENEVFIRKSWEKLILTWYANIKSNIDQNKNTEYNMRCVDFLLSLSTVKNLEQNSKSCKELLDNDLLWKVIQIAMCNKIPYIKKEATYLLKKSISITEINKEKFEISQEKGINISNFVSIIESLQESQVHLLKPFIQKLEDILRYQSSTAKLVLLSNADIHPSWIRCIFSILLSHENRLIIQEGVKLLLKFKGSQLIFLLDDEGINFIFQDIFLALRNSTIFLETFWDEENSVPNKSPLSSQLDSFFNSVFLNCSNNKFFLKTLLTVIKDINWPGVPLFYILLSLKTLPDTQIWDSKDLNLFRDLLLKFNRAFDIDFYTAIEDLFLKCLFKFCDIESVTIKDVTKAIHINERSLDHCTQLGKWISLHGKDFKGMKEENTNRYAMFCLEQYLLNNEEMIDVNHEPQQIAFLLNSILRGFSDTKESKVLLEQVMNRLCEITDKAATHLYLPKAKIFRATILASNLFHLTSGATEMYISYAKRFSVGILSYISNCIANIELDEKILIYLIKPCEIFLNFINKNSRSFYTACDGYIVSIITQALTHYIHQANCQNQLGLVRYLGIFSHACSILDLSKLDLNSNTLKLTYDFVSMLDLCASKFPITNLNSKDGGWAKLKERYIVFQWRCLPCVLNLNAVKILEKIELKLKSILNEISDLLEVISEKNIHFVFKGLQHIISLILNKNTESEDAISFVTHSISCCWEYMLGIQNSAYFWSLYKTFIIAALQNNTLCSGNSEIQSTLNELFNNIVKVGSQKPKVLLYAAMQFVNVLLDQKQSLFKFIQPYKQFVVQCLVFNHIKNKEDVALSNTKLLAYSMLERKTEDNFIFEILTNDAINLMMITTLLQLKPSEDDVQKFIYQIILDLLNLDKYLTRRKPQYHRDSKQHIIKDRTWQSILLLLKYIPRNVEDEIIEKVLQCLSNDAQPSVRYLMEWSTVVLLNKFPVHIENILSHLRTNKYLKTTADKSNSSKFSTVCSYLTVTLLVGKLKEKSEIKDQYYIDLANICLPWCMTQHFSVRLYALAGLLSVKSYFEKINNLERLYKCFPSLPHCLDFADNASGNVGKSWEKMKNNFMLFHLNAIDDISLESVYCDLPRLCLSQSCNKVVLKRLNERNICLSVPLMNQSNNLGSLISASWLPAERKQVEETNKCDGGANLTISEEDPSAMMQKKFIPWLDNMDKNYISNPDNKCGEGLILVASLLEKTSNLGGLTRTCEIFGAECIVVKSLSCSSDKLFQSLSVTAENWIKMKEVKPWALVDFLKEKKKSGYCVVGTEQTSNSVTLDKFKFPKKCVVVLGNEKEGIPSTILQQLDACVEIPQLGVIRSLNVHVSGAITVWEYAKQNMLKT